MAQWLNVTWPMSRISNLFQQWYQTTSNPEKFPKAFPTTSNPEQYPKALPTTSNPEPYQALPHVFF